MSGPSERERRFPVLRGIGSRVRLSRTSSSASMTSARSRGSSPLDPMLHPPMEILDPLPITDGINECAPLPPTFSMATLPAPPSGVPSRDSSSATLAHFDSSASLVSLALPPPPPQQQHRRLLGALTDEDGDDGAGSDADDAQGRLAFASSESTLGQYGATAPSHMHSSSDDHQREEDRSNDGDDGDENNEEEDDDEDALSFRTPSPDEPLSRSSTLHQRKSFGTAQRAHLLRSLADGQKHSTASVANLEDLVQQDIQRLLIGQPDHRSGEQDGSSDSSFSSLSFSDSDDDSGKEVSDPANGPGARDRTGIVSSLPSLPLNPGPVMAQPIAPMVAASFPQPARPVRRSSGPASTSPPPSTLAPVLSAVMTRPLGPSDHDHAQPSVPPAAGMRRRQGSTSLLPLEPRRSSEPSTLSSLEHRQGVRPQPGHRHARQLSRGDDDDVRRASTGQLVGVLPAVRGKFQHEMVRRFLRRRQAELQHRDEQYDGMGWKQMRRAILEHVRDQHHQAHGRHGNPSMATISRGAGSRAAPRLAAMAAVSQSTSAPASGTSGSAHAARQRRSATQRWRMLRDAVREQQQHDDTKEDGTAADAAGSSTTAGWDFLAKNMEQVLAVEGARALLDVLSDSDNDDEDYEAHFAWMDELLDPTNKSLLEHEDLDDEALYKEMPFLRVLDEAAKRAERKVFKQAGMAVMAASKSVRRRRDGATRSRVASTGSAGTGKTRSLSNSTSNSTAASGGGGKSRSNSNYSCAGKPRSTSYGAGRRSADGSNRQASAATGPGKLPQLSASTSATTLATPPSSALPSYQRPSMRGAVTASRAFIPAGKARVPATPVPASSQASSSSSQSLLIDVGGGTQAMVSRSEEARRRAVRKAVTGPPSSASVPTLTSLLDQADRVVTGKRYARHASSIMHAGRQDGEDAAVRPRPPGRRGGAGTSLTRSESLRSMPSSRRSNVSGIDIIGSNNNTTNTTPAVGMVRSVSRVSVQSGRGAISPQTVQRKDVHGSHGTGLRRSTSCVSLASDTSDSGAAAGGMWRSPSRQLIMAPGMRRQTSTTSIGAGSGGRKTLQRSSSKSSVNVSGHRRQRSMLSNDTSSLRVMMP